MQIRHLECLCVTIGEVCFECNNLSVTKGCMMNNGTCGDKWYIF